MNIIVCIKQIQDPEIPASKFRLGADGKKVIPPEGIPPVINPYDEQAVELALRIKEKRGGQITILTIGEEGASRAVKHALAMGADEGILLQDLTFEGSDSLATAHILTRAIQKIEEFDLILCGRQAADWDEGLVGSILAENLELPLVTLAESADFIEDRWRVKRVILDGYQIFAAPSPAVLTVSHELGPPRLPSGWGIITASKKEIPVWDAKFIGTEPTQIGADASRKKLIKLFIPQRERKCDKIEGEKPEDATSRLVEKLRTAGVL
ncbi:MAG: electron transfer flavoprotein subunit beta/FixA family protein [Candidatus Aminicenantes bacterium]|nr:MAG: electron transfer flavoprotein subunit beta/FixA family protein [Candidatus Aminicenantes bacterium]